MKNLLLILILLLSDFIYSQPGYVEHKYNINNLPEDYAIQNAKWPDIYRLTVLIDSTTSDFSKLRLLKNHKEITFEIKTSKFPKQLNFVSFDSIRKVTFYCSGVVRDISNLKGFKKVKELNFMNYTGKKLPSILSQFNHLERLNLLECKKLKNIVVLKNIKQLKSFTIDCSSLENFPEFAEDNKILNIQLRNLDQNVNLGNLNKLSNLGAIEMNISTELNNIPANLTPTLNSITVTGNVLSISNITFYKELQVIRINSTQLKSFDVDLGKNKNHLNIGLSNNQRMENISGIYTCPKLEYLILSELPLLSELDITNLSLEKGLYLESTGIRNIKSSNKLEELTYLYIHNNPFLNIELIPNARRSIFNNGKLK